MNEEFYFTEEQLKALQALPLEEKIQTSLAKILQTFSLTNGNIYVAYSGGKDSGVLLDIVAHAWSITKHREKPLLIGFANTGMEYMGMIQFVKDFVELIEERYSIKTRLIITNPKKTFKEIIVEDGYPVVSKMSAEHIRLIRNQLQLAGLAREEVEDHLAPTMANYEWFIKKGVSRWATVLLTTVKPDGSLVGKGHSKLAKRWLPLLWAPFKVSENCCKHLKKRPQREMGEAMGGASPILGTMADESWHRRFMYLKHGCVNVIGVGKVRTTPLGFWTAQDIYEYYYKFPEIPLFRAYGKAIKTDEGAYQLNGLMNRTGCKLCMFGCAYKDSGIHYLKDVEPHACEVALRPLDEGGFGYADVIEYLNTYCGCDIDLGQDGIQLNIDLVN